MIPHHIKEQETRLTLQEHDDDDDDNDELQIDSMYLEQVQYYKYLRSNISIDNSIEEEIQYSITLGNKAYYVNHFF